MSESRAAQSVESPALSGSCQARYTTGEFAGIKCIEDAKEERYSLGFCHRHAKMWDRWLKFGYDYARSMAKYDWGIDFHA